jgi:hypothetical protein
MQLPLSVIDSDGSEVALRHYHHACDTDETRHGVVADPFSLLDNLLQRGRQNVGINNLILCLWEDGISQSCSHVVSGLAWIIGKMRGTFGRAYDFHGSDEESSVLQLALSFLVTRCNEGGPVCGVALIYDHGMGFSRFNAFAGNGAEASRNPMVSIPKKFQTFLFYGKKRSIASLLAESKELIRVCSRIASALDNVDDLSCTAAVKVLRACKISVTRGTVDCPGVLQYSVHDMWGLWRNFKVLQVWHKMIKFTPPDWLATAGVLINMRHPFPLSSNGHLALTAYIPKGAFFVVTDVNGNEVRFDVIHVSMAPIAPGTRLFLQHTHYVNPAMVVSVPPSLHCTLNLVVLVLETLTRTLVPGGKVFDKDTDGFSLKNLQALVDRVKQVILGRGHVVHSYTNLSSFTPLFDAWLDTLEEITHPALMFLPPIMSAVLRTRVCNDHSLRLEFQRYCLYRMSILFNPLVCAVEVAEISRRQTLGATGLKDYLNVHAFRKQQDIHVPIEVKHVSPLLASVTDEDVHDLGSLQADLLKEKGDENVHEDDNMAAETIEKVVTQVQQAKKYHKFGGIYVASLLCALPRALSDLSRLSGRNVLLVDVLEDACEARLKPAKKLEREVISRTMWGNSDSLSIRCCRMCKKNPIFNHRTSGRVRE